MKDKFNSVNMKEFLVQNAIYFVLGALLIGIILKEPTFLSLTNFTNILSQSSVRIIIALGIAGIIVTQGTDLSGGRQVGLAALISATLLQSSTAANKVFANIGEVPIVVVLLLVIVIGAIIGAINGLIVSKFHVTPFIATMGTMIIVYGANSIYFDKVGASPVSSFSTSFSNVAQGAIVLGSYRIPYLIFYAIIAIVIMWIIWNKTIFGKNVFAVGGNPEAAAVSGVDVSITLIKIYALASACYAVGGLLEAGRVGSATNNLGNMYEFDAIAACVVGGVSFSGGIGTVKGIVTGVIIFTVINYGLTYIGVNPYWQYIIKGLIIVSAVALDTRKYLRKK